MHGSRFGEGNEYAAGQEVARLRRVLRKDGSRAAQGLRGGLPGGSRTAGLVAVESKDDRHAAARGNRTDDTARSAARNRGATAGSRAVGVYACGERVRSGNRLPGGGGWIQGLYVRLNRESLRLARWIRKDNAASGAGRGGETVSGAVRARGDEKDRAIHGAGLGDAERDGGNHRCYD